MEGKKKTQQQQNHFFFFFKSQFVGQLVPLLERERETFITHHPIETKEITCMQPSTLNEEGRKAGKEEEEEEETQPTQVFFYPTISSNLA
jgi:hypothetical protein